MSKLSEANTHPKQSGRRYLIYGAMMLVLLGVFLVLRNWYTRDTIDTTDYAPPSPPAPGGRRAVNMQLNGQTEDGLIILSRQPEPAHSKGDDAGAEDSATERVEVAPHLKDLKAEELSVVKDGKPISSAEMRAYYYLAWQAYLLKDGAATAEPRQVELRRTRMFENPADLRGKLLRIQGDVGYVKVLNLDPNPTGRLRIYQVGLTSRDGGPIFVLVWNDPGASGIRIWDTVTIDALFFKIWQHSENEAHTAPLLMAYELKVMPAPYRDLPLIIGALLAALVVLALVLMLIGRARSARSVSPSDRFSDEHRRELEEFDRQINR